MKFINISILLISFSLNLVSGFLMKRDDILEMSYDYKKVSDECSADLKKAMKCINKLNSKIESKADEIEDLLIDKYCDPTIRDNTDPTKCKELVKKVLKMGCEVFDSDDCEDFIDEDAITKIISNTKCVKEEKGIGLLLKLAIIKGSYLMACNKNKKDDYCPLANYVTNDGIDFMFNNIKTITKLVENRYEYDSNNDFEAILDASNDGLALRSILTSLNKILADTCTDSACNKNIIAIDKMIMAGKAAYEKEQNTDLTKKYPKVFEFYDKNLESYRNGKCESASLNILKFSESSAVTTVKKISYAFVTMITVSILLLL